MFWENKEGLFSHKKEPSQVHGGKRILLLDTLLLDTLAARAPIWWNIERATNQ